jgi:alpha-beta hydrolase superfamily lysophospholipase
MTNPDRQYPIDAPVTGADDRVSLPQWRYAPDAWRWVRRFDERKARSLFRLRSARVMPQSMRARFLAMGIPADILESTLAGIRSPQDWPNAWVETAQRFLGDYRRQVSARHMLEAAQARRLAALSYHSAQLFSTHDDRTTRTCRAAAASLFAQAQPYVYPKARRVMIPWRAHQLAAYIQLPPGDSARNGLVVMLNGASTSKEESFAWAENFLRAGLAVLAVDTPGTGEATSIPNPDHDEDDLLDGVFDAMLHNPAIDLSQVSVVGVSMGGNLAIRCAAYDRRIMSTLVVTPPYDPARWIGHASPLLLHQIGDMIGSDAADPYEAVDRFSLHDVVPQVKSPLMVFGAGRDLVVPPSEAQLLAARAGALGSLIWYPTSGHCLYDAIPAWTAEAAMWISSIAAARAMEYQTSGFADPLHIAEIARQQLQSAGTLDDDFFDDEGSANLLEPEESDVDDAGSFARIITPAPRQESPGDHAT